MSEPTIILCNNYLVCSSDVDVMTKSLPEIYELQDDGPKERMVNKKSAHILLEALYDKHQEREHIYYKATKAGTLDQFKQSIYAKKRLAFEGYSTILHGLHLERPKIVSMKQAGKNSIILTCRYSTTSGDIERKDFTLELEH